MNDLIISARKQSIPDSRIRKAPANETIAYAALRSQLAGLIERGEYMKCVEIASKTPDATTCASQFLFYNDPAMRKNAIRVLAITGGRISLAPIIPELKKALRDDIWDVSAGAAGVLTDIMQWNDGLHKAAYALVESAFDEHLERSECGLENLSTAISNMMSIDPPPHIRTKAILKAFMDFGASKQFICEAEQNSPQYRSFAGYMSRMTAGAEKNLMITWSE